MTRNGHNRKSKIQNPKSILEGLVIPGLDDSAYTALRMRLDWYDDYILARQYTDGQPTPFYCLDPLDVAIALADVTIGTPALPRNCLFWQRQGDSERLAIYCEPQVWQVYVAGGRQRRRMRVPMPGLVWIGQGVNYRLYAVKVAGSKVAGSKVAEFWPDDQTELFNAPCPNVSSGICRGNVDFPPASAATIWPALRLFFESDFNDHLSNGKSRAQPGNVLRQWESLAGAEAWPVDDLVSAGMTLGRVREGS